MSIDNQRNPLNQFNLVFVAPKDVSYQTLKYVTFLSKHSIFIHNVDLTLIGRVYNQTGALELPPCHGLILCARGRKSCNRTADRLLQLRVSCASSHIT